MTPWKKALGEGLMAGSVATAASTAALAVAGRLENRRAAAPVNAVSHWAWPREPGPMGAAITAAVAALVDLRMTPERLTPGFKRRLSNTALVAVYASFALGLLAGARLAEEN